MLTLFFMVIFLFVMLLAAYNFFGKDIMSPAFILCAGYLLSFVWAVYNYFTLNIGVGISTVIIYMTAIFSFFAGCFFVNRLRPAQIKKIDVVTVEISEIKVGFIKYLFCVAVCLIILFMTYREVERIANLNFASWGNLTYNFKSNVGSEDLENSNISTLVLQLNKVTKGFGLVFIYIFINNLFALKNKTVFAKIGNLKNLVPGIIYILQCTAEGNRIYSIGLIVGAGFIFYFLWRIKVGWVREIKMKYIIISISAVVALFIVFWVSKELVGRMASETSSVDYFAHYLGGAPYLFDSYLNDALYQNDGVHETFSGICQALNKYGLTDIPCRVSHEFRRAPNGVLIGNAQSALRNYFHDFGIIGVIVFNFLLAVIFGAIYNRMKTASGSENKNVFLILLHASLIYTVLFQCFEDFFFARWAPGFVVDIFILWVCYFFVLRIKTKRFIVSVARC